jgi:formiminotetrahydrofolate cyclodeaminase
MPLPAEPSNSFLASKSPKDTQISKTARQKELLEALPTAYAPPTPLSFDMFIVFSLIALFV